jgi:hypothetical protein
MDRLDPATEQYLRKALRAAHAKGVRAGRAEVMASMFAGLNGDGERVLTKALRGVLTKAFDESEHPRDDHGRFVKGEDIEAAKSDPAKAQELRGRVTDPGQRAKLEKQLGGTEAADRTEGRGGDGIPEEGEDRTRRLARLAGVLCIGISACGRSRGPVSQVVLG